MAFQMKSGVESAAEFITAGTEVGASGASRGKIGQYILSRLYKPSKNLSKQNHHLVCSSRAMYKTLSKQPPG